MRSAVLRMLGEATIIIKAAAPADYRPQKRAAQKIHKAAKELSLALEPTEDILLEIGRLKGNRIVVGFAAETEDVLASARRKLESKNLDMVVANDVSQGESGFDSDYNSAVLIGRGGLERDIPKVLKSDLANEILGEVVRLRSPQPAGKR